jgi:hypothetical protein
LCCGVGWSRKYAVPLLDAHTPRKIRVGFKDSGIHRLATWWTDLWSSRSLAQKTRLGTLVVMLWRRWCCRVVVVTEGASQQDRGLGRMSQCTAAWVAWCVCAVSLVLVGFALVLIFFGWSTPLPKGWTPWPDQAVSLVGVLGAPVLGGLIASRRPENPYGWLWLALGFFQREGAPAGALARLQTSAHRSQGLPGSRTGRGFAGAFAPQTQEVRQTHEECVDAGSRC